MHHLVISTLTSLMIVLRMLVLPRSSWSIGVEVRIKVRMVQDMTYRCCYSCLSCSEVSSDFQTMNMVDKSGIKVEENVIEIKKLLLTDDP